MRFATVRTKSTETAAVVVSRGLVLMRTLNQKKGTAWETDLYQLIVKDQIPQLVAWYQAGGKEDLELLDCIPAEEVKYGPLYRHPERIFCIGLNYAEHAAELSETTPKGFPGSFYKPATTIVGPGDDICIPAMEEAQKTTAEGELGIIIGKKCKFIGEGNWQDYVVGYTTILDMTEESILRLNTRFLTLCKGFDTFLSFGPQLVTKDEVPDVLRLEVQSVHNGRIHGNNTVSNMTHKPARLVSVVSHMQGWLPGDILSTGTPRAFTISEGDTAECRIYGPDGFAMEPLVNPVIDLKLRK